MAKPEAPKVPECEKLRRKRSEISVLTEFLTWLRDDKKIVLANWIGDELRADLTRDQKIIYTYLEIDDKKLEEERRALLDYQRALNTQ